MSVTGTGVIKRRPSGLEFPYPDTIWYAQGAVIGDASGGGRVVEITLNPAGTTRSGRSWSIELSVPSDTGTGTRNCIMDSFNMDVAGPGLTNPIRRGFVQELSSASQGGTSSKAGQARVRDMWPHLFLGSQGASASDASIEMSITNTDLETFGWYATGYEWAAGALNSGLWRPRDGLFAL